MNLFCFIAKNPNNIHLVENIFTEDLFDFLCLNLKYKISTETSPKSLNLLESIFKLNKDQDDSHIDFLLKFNKMEGFEVVSKAVENRSNDEIINLWSTISDQIHEGD